MTFYLTLYAGGCLCATSLLYAWFNTGLSLHVLNILRVLGWKKDWQEFDEFSASFNHFIMWLGLNRTGTWLYDFISELITCPVCLSFHASFWISTIMSLTVAFFTGFWDICWLIPFAVFGWPIIINIILNRVVPEPPTVNIHENSTTPDHE